MRVEGPPFIWIALTTSRLAQYMARAKGDCLSGDMLLRVDQVEAPGKPVTVHLPKERLEPWDNEILYADDWEFIQINSEGDLESFSDVEVSYLFFPDCPEWREFFSHAPFVTIPCPICVPHG